MLFRSILVWRFNVLIVIFFFLVFGALDGAYLSAALTKVPSGAWFTIMLASILSCVFDLWRFGKEQKWSAEREDRLQPSHLLSSTDNGDFKLTAAYGGSFVTKTPGIGIFFEKAGDMVPIVFAKFERKFSARPEMIIFFHMPPLSMPTIPDPERFVIHPTWLYGLNRLS